MKKVSVSIPVQDWGTIKTKYPAGSIFVNLEDQIGGSKNYDSILHGSLSKRPGSTLYGTPANIIKDQYEAVFTDGNHHMLVVGGGTLQYSSGGGTFATVTSGYSALGNFEFGLYQDRVYFDNGIDSPQVYDRTTSYGGVSYSAPRTKVMGAQAPGSAPVASLNSDSTANQVPAGGHTYKVTFLYYGSEESNGGLVSNLVTNDATHTSNGVTLAIGGYGVTARKVYRDNNDGNWLLVGSVLDNTTTSFTDKASVGTAAIPITNSMPPTFKYISIRLDRAWIAGVPGDPSGLYFSSAGQPDIFPSANRILCNPEDPITAITVYNDRIIVFNRRSLGQILGTTSDTFSYSAIPSSVGCVDNRSIQIRTINGYPTLIWLSDKGIYGTNGWVVNYLSDPIEDLVNLNIQQASQVRGQNAQATQSAFQAGTASPAIDLVSQPGKITTNNPTRRWQAEADWEGGSALSNVNTHNASNQILPVAQHAPAFANGTLSNVQVVNGNLQLATTGDFTGESLSEAGKEDFYARAINTQTNVSKFAQAFVPALNGTLGTVSNIDLNSFSPGSPGTVPVTVAVYTDFGGLPGTSLASQTFNILVSGDNPLNIPAATLNVSLTGGTTYWLVVSLGTISGGGQGFFSAFGYTSGSWTSGQNAFAFKNLTTWQMFGSPDVAFSAPLAATYTYTKTSVAASGLWIGPTYDTLSDNPIPTTLVVSGTYPAGTTATLIVRAANDSAFTVSVLTQTLNSPNGSTAVTISGRRYWRIEITLQTGDNRVTPSVGTPVLNFQLSAIWTSEVLDHTTDITALNALTSTQNIPGGTSITVLIATSADNVTYTSYGPVGSAVVQRYSKVQITLNTPDGIALPSVTNAELDWTVVSNLVSSAIDTGNTPAGWDIFQASFTLNSGTVSFFMRTASTLGGLGSASFVAVTNGSFPAVTVNEFAQWKVVITSTANAVPTVSSVTINWLISQTNSIRVASLFYNRSYYIAAAEYNQTANNLVLVFDGTNKWRIYRDLSINAFSYFFNVPYYSSATAAQVVQFLSGTSDQGTPITMIVELKSMDFGDLEHRKIVRKVYIRGKNTGAVYQVLASVDEGLTYQNMIDTATGLITYPSTTNGDRFVRRFVIPFTVGNVDYAGLKIRIKVIEQTAAYAEIDAIKVEAWIRAGELVPG